LVTEGEMKNAVMDEVKKHSPVTAEGKLKKWPRR
jgi:hypothetical protein